VSDCCRAPVRLFMTTGVSCSTRAERKTSEAFAIYIYRLISGLSEVIAEALSVEPFKALSHCSWDHHPGASGTTSDMCQHCRRKAQV
jgi:hypothetical protein